ncbi:MAG: hypothetical protein MR028_09700 [Ligilactobacillus agilis]|uniref:hypothetical protein n=1 Tax=Ligilactobacillus agilis TaxID=1601 RepID=UPI00242DD470|nr:hypothetical protein [Ligilactobacillus agilis]MCI5762681.1 hypothetical protein [Ligilactobacillus agilis]
MANFTINSLSTGSIADTDTFLKSNTDGTLTKTTASAVKDYVLPNFNGYTIGTNWTSTGSLAVTSADTLVWSTSMTNKEKVNPYVILTSFFMSTSNASVPATLKVYVDDKLWYQRSTNSTTLVSVNGFGASALAAGTHTISAYVGLSDYAKGATATFKYLESSTLAFGIGIG